MQVFGRMLDVLIGLVLLSCMTEAIAGSKVDTKLIYETEIKEDLTREEMLVQLNSLKSPDHVARILSLVKDKSSTRVTGGLSADQLLAQNEISTSQCSRKSLRMRLAVCERTKNFTIVNSYCRLCVVEAVRFCIEKLDSMFEEGLIDEADRGLLLRLSSNIARHHEDGNNSEFGSLRTPLEQLVALSFDL